MVGGLFCFFFPPALISGGVLIQNIISYLAIYPSRSLLVYPRVGIHQVLQYEFVQSYPFRRLADRL